MSRKLIVLILVIISTTWLLLYNLKSFNIYGTNFPCVGFTTYTLGEFYEKNSEEIDSYYFREENEYNIWAMPDMKIGNINSIEDIAKIPYLDEIKELFIDGMCIKEINSTKELEKIEGLSLSDTKIRTLDGFSNMTNLEELNLNNTKIKKLEGLENMENLSRLSLCKTKISTIENVENIRNNTSSELIIRFGRLDGGKDIKKITQESYEYAINPENNIRIRIFNKNCKVTITGQDFGDSKEEIEACINIV